MSKMGSSGNPEFKQCDKKNFNFMFFEAHPPGSGSTSGSKWRKNWNQDPDPHNNRCGSAMLENTFSKVKKCTLKLKKFTTEILTDLGMVFLQLPGHRADMVHHLYRISASAIRSGRSSRKLHQQATFNRLFETKI